ncbi:MFS transporter [Actinomyces oricola]
MPTATSVTSNTVRYRVSPHAPIFKISLLSIALMLSDVGAVSPVLPDLAAHYPDQDQASIQGFISFPAIAALAATITAGALATRVGKRRLVLTGISLIVVGGLAPIFLIPITSYPVVLGVRLLAGFGMGLLQPLASSLVADFYEGQERRTLLGWQSSMVGAGGIGLDVAEHPELVAPTVIMNHVPPAGEQALPPLLVVHGDKDRLVHFSQSIWLVEDLQAKGQDVTFIRLAGADHGGAPFWQEDVLDVVDGFLTEHLA